MTVGNGDAQNFTYDKSTGRMTSYAASVGATPVTITGNLTWNPNGTLAENNIIDGYNSANTQDCKYLYDDFMRVASGLDSTPGVKCMNGTTNIWNQTFAYDQFGNITKSTSGPGSAWAPGYNTANNHYTLANTVYDSNGNLTDDTFHSYTWLADGHEATIKPSAHGTDPTTTSTLYDALGNKVEETVNGTTHEYVSGFGIMAQMTGQTLATANVGLPGGVEALYTAPGLTRFRFPDWQGSIRAESKPGDRVFSESVAFAPFGERYALKGAPYNVDSFTGKPDQLVSDEYDFAAREEHNGQGRWVSPDPMRGTGNKYVYANNNPLSNVDVYGLLAITVEGMETDTDVNPAESPSSAPHSESFQAKSQEAANSMGFLCSALDCSTPGTSDMLEGMGLAAAPQTQTPSSDTSAQTKTEQAKGQPEKTAQNQSQTKQLTADDVSKGIKAFDSDQSDKNPGRVVKALDTMGKDFTVSGDTLKQGVKDSGVAMPKAADKVLANVESITRTGDKVVITNKDSMRVDVLGKMEKTISFTINESAKGKSGYVGPELQNLKGVSIGIGPFAAHPDHWGPE